MKVECFVMNRKFGSEILRASRGRDRHADRHKDWFVRDGLFETADYGHHPIDGSNRWHDDRSDPLPFSPSDYNIRSFDSPVPAQTLVNHVLSQIEGVLINDQGLVAGVASLYSQGYSGRIVGGTSFTINNAVLTVSGSLELAGSAYDVLYKTPLDQTRQTVLGQSVVYLTPAGESESGFYVVGMDVNYSPAGVGLGDTPYVQYNGLSTALKIPAIGGKLVDYLTPEAVNDHGVIVGSAEILTNPSAANPDTLMGFIYDHGKTDTIAVPGAADTIATGINDAGEIVGYYVQDIAGHAYDHGFIDWHGRIRLFDIPGSTSTTITGINDNGQIVGDYTTAEPTIALEMGTVPIYAFSGSHVFIATPQLHGLG